ncbi:hypothetical protein JQ582_33080 [Bradyrhizobium japonicum]|uniref:hypothetical protein n=1 Tax=Bradyrhizobium japonicum TaxID=375 RepID=UPI001BA82458|nr:hypothetical protein [Bradyrhizobium japonicum]MBR0748776.1 hypothetical protein [Bradyrhizobium japonicum]
MIGFAPNPTKSQTWALGLASGLLIFFLFLIVVAVTHHNTTQYPHDDVDLAWSVHGDQCERPIDKGWIVELQNTLSNVGYALAGALILFRVQTWAGHLFGINLLLLSVASGSYHATLSGGLPQIFDVGWVYAVLLSLSTYAASVHIQAETPLRLSGSVMKLGSWRLNIPGWVIWIICGFAWIVLAVVSLKFDNGLVAIICLTIFIVVVEFLCYLAARVLTELKYVVVPALYIGIPLFGIMIKQKFHWDSTIVFIIMVGLLIIQFAAMFASAGGGKSRLKWVSLWWEMTLIAGLITPGFFFRLTDGYSTYLTPDGKQAAKTHLLCSPDLAFQAHAHWHILGAIGLLLSYDLITQFQRSNTGIIADQTVILPDESVTTGG